jgi:hypothetical protein
MGLASACKAETSRMKDVSVQNSGWGKYVCLLFEENCVFTEKSL